MKKLLNRKNKKGFTIIELVIVVGVIGILSAILIPTFTNLTSQAAAAAAVSDVRTAYEQYVLADVNALTITQVAVNRGSAWYTYSGSEWRSVSKPSTIENNEQPLYTYIDIGVYDAR